MAAEGLAAVVIGTEVLTAKVKDENGAHLIKRLRERGIPLRSMQVVHDEVDAIVEAVGLARRHAQHVLTSGGIGPTHDDVTVRAVALALGRKVVKLPEMVKLIQEHHPDKAAKEVWRLADAPEGTRLLPQEGSWFPVLACENVFLLPGVPQLFKLQLETVLTTLPGAPVHLRCIYLSLGEAGIAAILDRVALEMPDVAIGSYPQFGPDADHKVKLTVEGQDVSRVDVAFIRLQQELPAGSVLRVDAG